LFLESESTNQVSSEVQDEGIKIIESLLNAWSSRTSTSDDDAMMVDGEEDNLDVQAQLNELKKCVEEFQPQIQGNAWVQSLLAAF
jgi:DNA mismatch repair protein MSH2